MAQQDFEYSAFISYSSADTAWAKRLHRRLEHYKMPSKMCSDRGWKRKPLNPIFFAPFEIQPGGLSDELKKHLRESKNLIVICSPNSAKSTWVGKEIEYFHSLGRDENIFFFIIEGIPHSGDPATECFNKVVDEIGLPENLGANIHETVFKYPWLNRERAFIQIISKLLNVRFDTMWKRHKRQLIAKTISWSVGIIAVVAAMTLIWAKNQPFDTRIELNEVSVHNTSLPPLSNAVLTMYLDRETISDTICHEGENGNFIDIPHKFLGKEVRITFACRDFFPLDTIVTLTRNISLNISRDPSVYGNIRKLLWLWRTEEGAANTTTYIDDYEVTSDSEGMVSLSLPLAEQKEFYIIEVPEWSLSDTIFMPCSDGQIIDLEK